MPDPPRPPPRSFKATPPSEAPAAPLRAPQPSAPAVAGRPYGGSPTGVWGLVVLAGLGLVVLARLIILVKVLGDSSGADGVALTAYVLTELGILALASGLALLGSFQAGLTMGPRIAAFLGAGFFLATAAAFEILQMLLRSAFR